MLDIGRWIWSHPLPAAQIFIIFYLIGITLSAYIQGREISVWPPRIGGKPVRIQMGQDAQGTTSAVMNSIKIRKSIRSYLDQPVEDEKLLQIMEMARLAPSASNRQEWRFVIVREKAVLRKIAMASCIGTFVKNAPLIIAACAETDLHVMQCGQMSYPIDVAISLDHISLTATALGLGTCWVGMFNEARVKEILGIPDKVRVVELMVLGYPTDPTPVEKKRLPMDRIMKYEHW